MLSSTGPSIGFWSTPLQVSFNLEIKPLFLSFELSNSRKTLLYPRAKSESLQKGQGQSETCVSIFGGNRSALSNFINTPMNAQSILIALLGFTVLERLIDSSSLIHIYPSIY